MRIYIAAWMIYHDELAEENAGWSKYYVHEAKRYALERHFWSETLRFSREHALLAQEHQALADYYTKQLEE